jgi:hypothetical protein
VCKKVEDVHQTRSNMEEAAWGGLGCRRFAAGAGCQCGRPERDGHRCRPVGGACDRRVARRSSGPTTIGNINSRLARRNLCPRAEHAYGAEVTDACVPVRSLLGWVMRDRPRVPVSQSLTITYRLRLGDPVLSVAPAPRPASTARTLSPEVASSSESGGSTGSRPCLNRASTSALVRCCLLTKHGRGSDA